MESLTVYSCGTPVTIKMNNAKGLITSILIRPGNFVSYEISYWNNNEYTINHLHDFEFSPEDSKQSKIGFK